MKTHILPICLSLGLLASVSAQENPAKPAADDAAKAEQETNRVATMKNLRAIEALLIEFDVDYGSFPDDETAAEVTDATGTDLKFEGGTSNDYFRQLLAGGGGKSEKPFQFGSPAKRADDKWATTDQAFAKGECDFAYLRGATASSQPDRPVVLAPLVPGKMEFDPKPFGGKAVILHVDGSVTAPPINEKGEVIVNGKSLFDPTQSYWQGKKPEVAWPK